MTFVQESPMPDTPMPLLPAGACDCHIHFFDDHYPYAENARRVPPARPADYRAVQARLRTTRAVVVAPSSYGYDNRCTLDGLAALGDQARAIVALPSDTADDRLAELHRQGVRGVRLNLARGNATSIENLDRIARKIAPLGWHVQMMMTPEQLVQHGDALRRLPTRLVIDHMARIPQDGGTASAAYPVLRKLLDGGQTWVKLSLASSARLLGTQHEYMLHAMGRDLVANALDRLVWGSDWPHVLSTLDDVAQPSDEDMLRLLLDWAPGQAQQRQILCDAPALLYDFPSPIST